jgi:hypothetical protein
MSCLDSDMVVASLLPSSEVQVQCTLWLKNYFDIYGDKSPNSQLTLIISITKMEIYKEYVKEMEALPSKHCGYSDFVALWNSLYPYCKRRDLSGIIGKCMTCYLIDNKKRTVSEKTVQKYLTEAHLLHSGGLFKIERMRLCFHNIFKYCDDTELFFNQCSYQNRRNEAILNKDKILSIIIDGMDQNHSRCPYMGTQNQFPDTISQMIVGVKEHGHGVSIFRVMPTVSKGANVTIYCILSVLEKWYERNSRFPDTIYVQMDGGSENANKYLLAICELLVCKRLAIKLFISRLPTGTKFRIKDILGKQ